MTGPKSKILKRESTTITLLNEHIIKQTPNNLSLYPQISASLKPHLGIFFLQWMVINTETHNQSRCRDYEAAEWSALNGTSHLLLPRLGVIMTEGQKDCEKPEARKQCFQTQQGSCLSELTALLTAHIRPVQAHSRLNPGTERGGGHETPSQLKSYWPLIAAGRGRVSLL